MIVRRGVATVGLLVWALYAVSCVLSPTEVVVSVDTDVPPDRLVTLAIRVGTDVATVASVTPFTWTRVGPGAASGSIALPASFAVVPRADARDAPVVVVVEAQVAGTSAQPAFMVRRTARFSFVHQQPLRLRLFLPVSCAASATGCSSGTVACTVQARCESMGQTCGDDGQCTTIDSVLVAASDDASTARPDSLARDAVAIDADAPTPDVRDAIAADMSSDTPVPVDIPRIDSPVSDTGPACPAGQTSCGRMCVDLLTDVTHCGTCTSVCPAPANGTARCSMGTCSIICAMGFHRCGGICASDTDVTACGMACVACVAPSGGTAACVTGMCVARCPAGRTLCGGACVDTSSDANNCGSCGRACVVGTGATGVACSASRCVSTCMNYLADCDGDDRTGCEVAVQTTANCGACGRVCTGGYSTCVFSLSSTTPRCGRRVMGVSWPSCGGVCMGSEVCGEDPGFFAYCCQP